MHSSFFCIRNEHNLHYSPKKAHATVNALWKGLNGRYTHEGGKAFPHQKYCKIVSQQQKQELHQTVSLSLFTHASTCRANAARAAVSQPWIPALSTYPSTR